MLVEEFAHGTDNGGALDECLLDAVVDDEVDIALAGAKLRVIELVIGHTILIFHDRQWLETLGEQGQLFGVNGNLTSLCLEDEALDADDITDVEQFLEDDIVEILVISLADVVACDVHLYTSLAILELHKACFAHDTAAHDAAGDSNIALFTVLEVVFDIL